MYADTGDTAIENILKPDTLTLFLYFVLPGFVAIKIYDLLIPTERRDFGAALIEVVSYSLFNWVLFASLLTVHNATDPSVLDFRSWGAFGSWGARIVYVFLSPAVLALLVYYLRNTRLIFISGYVPVGSIGGPPPGDPLLAQYPQVAPSSQPQVQAQQQPALQDPPPTVSGQGAG